MKKALGINSSEFMEQYTSIAYSAEKRVPVVFLKMNDGDKKCQFMSEKGCGVYANRPWACRMYPLGMAERATSQAAAERFYFVVKEELCHGHGKGGECAVREFIDGQGVEPYDVMQGPFRRLLALAAEQKEALTKTNAPCITWRSTISTAFDALFSRLASLTYLTSTKRGCMRSAPTTKNCWSWRSNGLPSACSNKK